MNKKILVVLALGLTHLMAKADNYNGTYVSVYGGKIDYKNSTKDKAYIAGVYLSQSFVPMQDPFKISIDASKMFLKYKEDYSSYNYVQKDLTGRIDFFYGRNFVYSIGGHKIFIDENENYKSWAIFTGINYYKYGLFNTGMDLYFSNYKNNIEQGDELSVYQASPYFGIYIGNPYSYFAEYFGTFYTQLKFDYQKLSKKDVFGKKQYLSGELKVINYHKNYSVEVEGEFGKTAYKVLNGGFILRNQNEETLYSFGAKLNVNLLPNLSLSLAYKRYRVKYSDNEKGNNNLTLALINYYF